MDVSAAKLNRGGLWVAIAAAALSLVVALGFAVPTQASAAEGGAELAAGSAQVVTQEDVSMVNPEWVSLWAGDSNYYSPGYFLMNYDSSLTITNVSSSNSSVLQVKKIDSGQNESSYQVKSVKAGSATITITYSQNGVTKTLSETYKVKAFTNGISSITFNGKALKKPTSEKAVTQDTVFEFKGKRGNINVKTANGWEVMSISGFFYKQTSNANKQIEITNGKDFAIPKGYQGSISISMYNSASGDNFHYSVGIYRHKPLELAAKSTYYVGYPKTTTPHLSFYYGNEKDIKITKVTSSNPSVIKVKKNKLFSKVKAQAKKAGTSTITIEYKYNGKTYKTTSKCTVSADYPLKKVAVNGKSVKLKKYCSYYFASPYAKDSAQFKVKAAKGWKIKSIKYYSDYSDSKGKKVKNGAKVSTAQGTEARVVITLKKGKTTFMYPLYFYRM